MSTIQIVDGDSVIIRDLTPEEQSLVDEGRQTGLLDGAKNHVARKLNSFAKTKGYASVDSAAKYIISDTDINAISSLDERTEMFKYRDEAKYISTVTAQTWARLFKILSEIENKTRPMFATYDELDAALPVLKWPDVD